MVAKVFYNQSCSICRAEINHYKKISKDEFDFVDITDNEMAKVETKSDAATLLRRMHVIENGILYSGAKAFLIVWSKIPRYKLLSKILGLPIIFTCFHIIYEIVALLLFWKNKDQLPTKK
jgi:predicted DCC family thiol-disulfide oxidoreductase YuxK